VTDAVICNSCAEACKEFIDSDGRAYSECVNINKLWGSDSPKDMLEQEANLCERCWDELTERWQVPVSEIDHMPGPSEEE
jgi:hypothetical protein